MAHTKSVKPTKKLQVKNLSLNSTELNEHRRTYRNINTLRIIDNTSVLALQVLEKKIKLSKKQLKQLNHEINNVDNKMVRTETKNFANQITSLLTEQDNLDEEIASCKTKIEHLKSQIGLVDIELEKYSAKLDNRFNADHKIETLDNRLFHSNQKMNLLKLEGLKLRDIVSDLLFMRRKFQINRDDIIARLQIRKAKVIELVDHYAIAFANGIRICHDLDTCRTRSAKLLKEHLQEMQHLIRTAETNEILREFMITKATPIQLTSDCVPQREILQANFEELSKICDGQLEQIEKYAPNVQPMDLEHKRRQTFSLYLLESEVTDNIEDCDKNVATLKTGISNAKRKINERKQKKQYLSSMKTTLNENESKIKKQSENVGTLESTLNHHLVQVQELYTMLACDVEFGSHGGNKVDRYNIDEVLQIIEIRLRNIMYSVYCWQEAKSKSNKSELVHGLDVVRPIDIPAIHLINPCPECSQVEARANPDIEKVIDEKGIVAEITEAMANRSIRPRIHHIEDCPKPGSKAVLANDLKN